MTRPTLRVERALLRSGAAIVIGIDEVGRGAIAGPVAVGAVAVTATSPPAPTGTRDSKLLSAAARRQLRPRIEQWTPSCAVGMASAIEIDRLGLTSAMKVAALRAVIAMKPVIDTLAGSGAIVVLLDGSHDYLTDLEQGAHWSVRTRVSADLTCSSVAAASILAKTQRDQLMQDLAVDYPDYGWDTNMGYPTASHRSMIAVRGSTPLHRYI